MRANGQGRRGAVERRIARVPLVPAMEAGYRPDTGGKREGNKAMERGKGPAGDPRGDDAVAPLVTCGSKRGGETGKAVGAGGAGNAAAPRARAALPVPEAPPLGLSLVTLGVGDLARAERFYTALGMVRRDRSTTGVVFYQADGRREPGAGGVVLALYPRHELAADAGVLAGKPGAFGGIALACNRASREDVDATIARALALGGKPLRPAQETFWGGYSGYVADPDGYAWEIAHNPFFGFDPDGRLILPE